MFETRKPRKFRRVSIYTSERQDRLDKIVKDAKREAGELPPETEIPSYKGRFAKFTPRASEASNSSFRLKWPVALIIILVLVLVWRYILTGNLSF